MLSVECWMFDVNDTNFASSLAGDCASLLACYPPNHGEAKPCSSFAGRSFFAFVSAC
jgi:hypothetical protein